MSEEYKNGESWYAPLKREEAAPAKEKKKKHLPVGWRIALGALLLFGLIAGSSMLFSNAGSETGGGDGGSIQIPAPGDQMPEDAQLLVLTTEDGILGASTLYYPGMTDRIARIVGGNYYVLPSSVHEVLIMPEGGRMSPEEMAQMVREINENEVSPKERLGNRVLHYREDLLLLQVAADTDRDCTAREERS